MIAIQIPKPQDADQFERCNLILWRCMLKDETAHLYGISGQRQNGVDILGCRNSDVNHLVGIQCKLKRGGRPLRANEVQGEVAKALEFSPPLSEYVIVTTAPDDANLQSLAKELSICSSKSRKQGLKISVLGWNSLQLEIQRYPEAFKAFNPSHIPQGDQILEEIGHISKDISALRNYNAVSIEHHGILSQYERLINDYAELIQGNPQTALKLLQNLQKEIESSTTDHIRFRIAANIAACQLEMGQEGTAANGLIAASAYAPDNPKAIANKAFGFLLLEKWDSVRKLGEQELLKQPNNALLAAHYIRSLIHDKDIDDPLSLIPGEVRSTPEVEQAHVAWLMQREGPNSWWDAAISAYHRYPKIAELQELGASALLSRAIGGERYVFGQTLDPDGHTDVNKAIQIYESLWSEIYNKKAKLRGDLSSIPVNLMIAYRIVGDNCTAIRVGQEASERLPDEYKVRECLSAFLVDEGEIDQASNLIAGLKETVDVATIRYKIAVSKKDWPTVIDLVDRYLSDFPDSEKNVALAMQIVARIGISRPEDARTVLEAGHGKFEGDTRALILLASTARIHGLEDDSDSFFDAAVTAFQNGDKTYASRLAITEESMVRNKFREAINALYGHVALDKDSGELRLLAQALVSDIPVRDRAIEFFRGLALEIRSKAFFQKLEGILHYNRGAHEEAIKYLSVAFEGEPNTETLLCLIGAYYRVNDLETIKKLLEATPIQELKGSPLDRIQLSRALVDFSEPDHVPDHAFDIAYTAVTDDLKNSELVTYFLALVLTTHSINWELRNGTVNSGKWVRLTSTGGVSYEALVGESQDRSWGEAVDTENSFIQGCLGLKVGDKFEIVNSLDNTETWEVSEIKPWWLQAFHHLTNSFGQRFPEAQGFFALNTSDGDIEPVLEQIRRHSMKERKRADVYLQHDIPLVLAAGVQRGGTLGFAQYLNSIGEQIKVCTGAPEELSEVLKWIQEHHRSGAVIDSFTAWHAAVLGILPVLKEHLGPISIPAHELSQLKAMIESSVDQSEGDSMSIGYRDGQYIRHIETPEKRAIRLGQMKSLVADIEKLCTVEPVQVPDHLPEHGENLIERLPPDTFTACIMAGDTRLLLCEDIVIRQMAREVFGTKGVWLQASLYSAEQAGIISVSTYADATVYLAAHHHGYVSINTPVLFSVFERDNSQGLSQLEVLCDYVGNENAEIQSHTQIVADFVNAIWVNAQPIVWVDDFKVDSKTSSATNLVFRSLLAKRREDDWSQWAASLYRRLTIKPRRYLFRWCEDNFLSVKQLLISLGQSGK